MRTKERQSTFEHPLAQSALTENRIGAILHTHAHTCMRSHIIHSRHADTHTHTAVHLSALLANQNLCLLSDVFAYQ